MTLWHGIVPSPLEGNWLNGGFVRVNWNVDDLAWARAGVLKKDWLYWT